MDYILKTEELCKSYRGFKALNGLSMNVPKGSIYGFVGKNGLRYKLKKLSFTSLR